MTGLRIWVIRSFGDSESIRYFFSRAIGGLREISMFLENEDSRNGFRRHFGSSAFPRSA